MPVHTVRVQHPAIPLAIEDQLAWRLATLATARPPVDSEAAATAVNRMIDNAAVAMAALDRAPVRQARAQARAHPRSGGAAVTGAAEARVSAEWAAWANGAAVRELDFHDTFLAADYSHPADTIPPILAVAQQTGRDGAAVLRAILTAYEVQVALVKTICLHAHRIDHITHLAPAQAAGLGALLDLEAPVIYQAINQAVHVSTTTRQSRKGQISSWKTMAPGHAGKLAVEAVDRAMRGGTAPAPIYEGADGLIAWLLDGPEAAYRVELPAPDAPRRAILETYTKAHSAEYQAQALIDLAFRLRARLPDTATVADIVIETSHHTHAVIGSGSGDPEKYDPEASRETLDHSIPYIFAVALEDGHFHHEASYAPDRARREQTVALWHKIRTVEDPAWTAAYRATDPTDQAFGGRARVRLEGGSEIVEELALAESHPRGARPFERKDYIAKFDTLATGTLAPGERNRFLELVQRLDRLDAREVTALQPVAAALQDDTTKGIF